MLRTWGTDHKPVSKDYKIKYKNMNSKFHRKVYESITKLKEGLKNEQNTFKKFFKFVMASSVTFEVHLSLTIENVVIGGISLESLTTTTKKTMTGRLLHSITYVDSFQITF